MLVWPAINRAAALDVTSGLKYIGFCCFCMAKDQSMCASCNAFCHAEVTSVQPLYNGSSSIMWYMFTLRNSTLVNTPYMIVLYTLSERDKNNGCKWPYR